MERPLNLSALAVCLGLEITEYEPEQFPGLITSLHDYACVVLVFASGKVVIHAVTRITNTWFLGDKVLA